MKADYSHFYDENRYKSPVSLSFDTPPKKGGFAQNIFSAYKIINAFCLPVFILLILFSSCNRNPLKVDISGIEEEVDVVRFEEKLFGLPMQDTLAELMELRNEHPDFFDLFTWKVIGIGGIEEKHFTKMMGQFLTDTMVCHVKTLAEKKFADFEKREKEIINAFKHYSYHFPDKELPKVYTMISGFNQSVVTAKDIIGIGLDKYLGRDCSYYKQLSTVPHYKIKNMHPQKIVADVVYAWGMTEFNE